MQVHNNTCCAPLQLLQLISVNTSAAAPNSITIIKNRENEGRIDGTCRVHIYILSNFSDECNKLRSTFLNLDYPINLINSAINKFLRNIDTIDAAKNTIDDSPTIMVPLPFKDQQSANSVKKQMQILSANIGVQIKPVFQTKKIGQILALKEKKPLIVNNQCVVYKFECDLCTARHLHQRINEHKYSAIGRHLEQHGLSTNDLVDKQFSVLKKCRSKFDCLIFEMLFIKELNPQLNTQKDSIRAKLFT